MAAKKDGSGPLDPAHIAVRCLKCLYKGVFGGNPPTVSRDLGGIRPDGARVGQSVCADAEASSRAIRIDSCAAASRATGTRKGEHET